MLVGDHEKVKAKYEELVAQYPENYLAIYDLPLDTDFKYTGSLSICVDWERRIWVKYENKKCSWQYDAGKEAYSKIDDLCVSF